MAIVRHCGTEYRPVATDGRPDQLYRDCSRMIKDIVRELELTRFPIRYYYHVPDGIWGNCGGWHVGGVTTRAEVSITADICPSLLVMCLAHELRHVYQWVYGLRKVGENGTSYWDNVLTPVCALDDPAYNNQPWEVDANQYAFKYWVNYQKAAGKLVY